jgi:ABC-type microcin C transport system duplicated ATPase subunit YejF
MTLGDQSNDVRYANLSDYPHRQAGGSVQRGLSVAIAAAAGPDICGAADNRQLLSAISLLNTWLAYAY